MAITSVDLGIREADLLEEQVDAGIVAPAPAPAPAPASHRRQAVVGWLVLGSAIVIGFHQTLISIATQSYNGDPLIYLFLLPLWGVIVACGTRLRRGLELDIHDRQIDWILALGPLAVAIVLINLLIAPRLGVTAGLVRIDVFAILLFTVFGCVLIFGARTTGRYWASWLLLLACWPLPYQMFGAALGGTTRAYAFMNVAISAAAIAIALGGRLLPRAGYAGMTFLVGAVAIIALHGAPTIVVELFPAALAPLVAIGFIVMRRRRSAEARATRAPRQLAVTKPRASHAVVLLGALCLGVFAHLAPTTIAASSLATTGPAWTPQPVVPATWHQGEVQHFSWAARYFGQGAQLTRYWFRPVRQPKSTPTQRIVVDALTTRAIGPLSVYPDIATYTLGSPYIQSPARVSLGHGVEATLFYANPSTAVDPVQSEWVLLSWTWRIRQAGHETFQRMSVVTTDGTPTPAAIPVPAPPWSNGSVRLVAEDALRGLAAPGTLGSSGRPPVRLVEFSRQIVDRQSGGTR